MYREHWHVPGLPWLPEELQYHLHMNSIWCFFLMLNICDTVRSQAVTVKSKIVVAQQWLIKTNAVNSFSNQKPSKHCQHLSSHPDVCELHSCPVSIQYDSWVGRELTPSPWRLCIEVQVFFIFTDFLYPDRNTRKMTLCEDSDPSQARNEQLLKAPTLCWRSTIPLLLSHLPPELHLKCEDWQQAAETIHQHSHKGELGGQEAPPSLPDTDTCRHLCRVDGLEKPRFDSLREPPNSTQVIRPNSNTAYKHNTVNACWLCAMQW